MYSQCLNSILYWKTLVSYSLYIWHLQAFMTMVNGRKQPYRKKSENLTRPQTPVRVCCAVNVPLPLTDTVQLPVNGPCKSRYLAINVICTTVISLNIQLYNCIAVFPRLHPNTTYMPNTDDTDYTDNRVVFIIWTDNVNAICTTTISSDIQLWYCIAVFPMLYPSNTYLPNTDYTDYTDNRVVFIIWTDNVNAPLTYHGR